MSSEMIVYLERYAEDASPVALNDALRAIFLFQEPGKWRKADEQKAKKKKKTEADENGVHIASNSELAANLSKTGRGKQYLQNFSDYIKGDGSRNKIYKEVSENASVLWGDKPHMMAFFKNYCLLGQFECNFNVKAKLDRKYNGTSKIVVSGTSKPYKWEGHHLIPGEAFYTKDSNGAFTEEQLKILRTCEYDINNGHNLIALPTNYMDMFQPVHNLIQHPSNHSNYTKRVVDEMEKVADNLNKAIKSAEEDHPDIKVEIAEKLTALEDDLWDLLIRLGKAVVTSKVAKIRLRLSREDAKLVKFKASSADTEYQFGALA
ncbi:AHH domain-containing protein [Aliikangiella maris]|uniref:AHH domain-containing protein n=2 Tax=Aliikangiella maris TaxID=3162458 RepID=A0ABV3MNB3_9GAMM